MLYDGFNPGVNITSMIPARDARDKFGYADAVICSFSAVVFCAQLRVCSRPDGVCRREGCCYGGISWK